MQVYLDNAATTPLDKEVFEAMKPYMLNAFGNPSSIHTHGREARAAIEKSRKKVADLLNTSPSEIVFTSGGTEADNTALRCFIESYKIAHVITTPIEHHAVLHTLQSLQQAGKIKLTFLDLNQTGELDLDQLESLLKDAENALVSIMHANNEIGNIYDIERIGDLCREFKAVFHSDTVQTVSHYPLDLQKIQAAAIAGAAHKFHGPKGVGFLYVNSNFKVHPLIHGGAQERNMRGGTENVYGIVGLAKAMELAHVDMESQKKYILTLKERMIGKLKETIAGVAFNGNSGDIDKSLYTVLNVSLPPSEDNDMLLFNLDIKKISVSGGSACSSGSNIGSHVLTALKCDPSRGAVRFSFSKYNTVEEIDYAVDKLAEICNVKA